MSKGLRSTSECSSASGSYRCEMQLERPGAPRLTGASKIEWSPVDWSNPLVSFDVTDLVPGKPTYLEVLG